MVRSLAFSRDVSHHPTKSTNQSHIGALFLLLRGTSTTPILVFVLFFFFFLHEGSRPVSAFVLSQDKDQEKISDESKRVLVYLLCTYVEYIALQYWRIDDMCVYHFRTRGSRPLTYIVDSDRESEFHRMKYTYIYFLLFPGNIAVYRVVRTINDSFFIPCSSSSRFEFNIDRSQYVCVFSPRSMAAPPYVTVSVLFCLWWWRPLCWWL